MTPQKIPLRENTGNVEIMTKHWELLCSSCKLLKIKDIAIFAAKLNATAKSVSHRKMSQITENGTGKICCQTGRKRVKTQ